MDSKMHGIEDTDNIALKVAVVDRNYMTFVEFDMDTTHIVEDCSMFVEG